VVNQNQTQISYAKEDWHFSKQFKVWFCIFISAVTGWFVPQYLAPGMETLLLISKSRLLVYITFFAFAHVIFLEVFGAYSTKTSKFPLRSLLLFLASSFCASLSLLVFVWLVEYDFVGRYVIFYLTIFTAFFCFILHFFIDQKSQKNSRRVLLCVPSKLRNFFRNNESSADEKIEWFELPEFSAEDGIVSFCEDQRVDIIVVDENFRSSNDALLRILGSGVQIMLSSRFAEKMFRRIPSESVTQSWLIHLELKLRDPFIKRFKRFADVFFSILGLVFLSPILVFSMLAIVMESGFPIFFSQSRVGQGGKVFSLHKLRTMRRDAESTGAKWAEEKDSRITKVGKFLRHWRIDEIPQFWNVIRGEMSMVGPRPERPEFEQSIAEKIPNWKCRTLVKPGITGWAQIRFKYAADIGSSAEKLGFDLFYLKNTSLLLDLEIMLATLRSLTRGSR
jgi:exopolysaccharide biosynthesis polyprenyl glycosylphosphotransferase